MAVTKALRNRIVGFLILLSLILMVLPLLISEPNTQGVAQQANEDIIAIDKNGALTDENGNILTVAEPDYATLLAPEEDHTTLTLTAPDPSAAPQLKTDNTEVLTAANQPSSPAPVEQLTAPKQEILTAPQVKPAPAPTPSNTEILRAPAKAEPKPAPVASATPAPTATVPQSGYTIQVGVFSQQSNAENAVRKLRAGNLTAYTEKVTINGKNMVRVYAGQASSRQALEPVLKQVERLTGAKGKIVSRK